MAKFEKRLEAHALRRSGWSIHSIAMHLEVSKSSASIWCRDLLLTESQKNRVLKNAARGGHLGRVKGALTNRLKKQNKIRFYSDAAVRDVADMSKRDFFIAGIALYWAEGSKKSHMSFTNSEPRLVKFMYGWFREIMGVSKDDFMPRIFINEIHRPRIKKVLRFWAELLKMPVSQFGKPVFLKRAPRKIYENYDTYYGVISLGARRSADLKYRILGLIDAVGNNSLIKNN